MEDRMKELWSRPGPMLQVGTKPSQAKLQSAKLKATDMYTSMNNYCYFKPLVCYAALLYNKII